MKYIKFHEAFDFVNTIWLKEQVSAIGKYIKEAFSFERKELLVCILAPGYETERKLTPEEVEYNKTHSYDEEEYEKKIIEAI